MKILILTTHLNAGGISRYVIDLAREFALNDKVWIASCKGEWLSKVSDFPVGFKIIPIRTKSIISIKVFLSLFILIPFVVKNKMVPGSVKRYHYFLNI